jgi:hypothetical protein
MGEGMSNMLKNWVGIKGKYQRSVNLTRDWEKRSGLEQYILTPTGRQIVKRILTGVYAEEGYDTTRSFSITGPYGTGKSAFALFLTDLLANDQPIHPAANEFRTNLGSPKKSFVPILLVGQRTSLKPALLHALGKSLDGIATDFAYKVNAYAQSENIPDQSVISFFEEAGQQVCQNGYAGLIIIIDEFGKFLEYAAQHPDTEDLFVLQDLAEMFDRSETPGIFLTVLHSAFEGYLPVLDDAHRNEWKKIQGRFYDISFIEPPEQFLSLIGDAIEWQESSEFGFVYEDYIEQIINRPAFSEARQRYPLSDLLIPCTPFDPITALLLYPLFRSKMAQNERSLFGFLIDAGPFGFQEFLSTNSLNPENPKLYRLDRLYDYVMQSLGMAVIGGDQSRRWFEIEHAIERIPVTAPDLAISIVKTIGLINMYGNVVGLSASVETIKLALGNPKDADFAIEYLEKASIIVFRRYISAYALWEGSDVNLEERYNEALSHIGHGNYSRRIKNALSIRPFVARAHYIKMGTMRFFDVDIIDGSSDNLKEAFDLKDNAGDGKIIFVLAIEAHERHTIINSAKELTQSNPRVLVAFTRPISGLEQSLHELEAWIWVRENTQALSGDPVARKEVAACILNAQRQINNIAGQVFGLRGYTFNPSLTDWIQGGVVHSPVTSLDFQQWLSSLCNDIYFQSPALHNELLNREKLSSSAASARRSLLQAMVQKSNEFQLGMVGTPPEVSMYRSLLLEGGFHQEINGVWQFTHPHKQWDAVWTEMEDFLKSSQNKRLQIIDLIERLKQPPFGLRDGPIYVLISILIMVHQKEIAIYEDGLFVPELRIEVIERLTRVPDIFQIQLYSISEETQAAFTIISQMLGSLQLTNSLDNSVNLLDVVKPLVMFANDLYEFTRKTKQLDVIEAIRVRDVLLKASDPHKLLFQDLPLAIGVRLQVENNELNTFVEVLKNCIVSLQNAYPALLNEIETQISEVFDLTSEDSQEKSRELYRRSSPLESYAVEGQLLPFVRAASHPDDRDWREVLGRVINQGKPTDHWLDNDLVKFRIRLLQLAGEFVRLEELATERDHSGASRILRIGILDGKMSEIRRVVPVFAENDDQINELASKIILLIEKETEKVGNSQQRVRIAAITQAVEHYLDGHNKNE